MTDEEEERIQALEDKWYAKIQATGEIMKEFAAIAYQIETRLDELEGRIILIIAQIEKSELNERVH